MQKKENDGTNPMFPQWCHFPSKPHGSGKRLVGPPCHFEDGNTLLPFAAVKEKQTPPFHPTFFRALAGDETWRKRWEEEAEGERGKEKEKLTAPLKGLSTAGPMSEKSRRDYIKIPTYITPYSTFPSCVRICICTWWKARKALIGYFCHWYLLFKKVSRFLTI